MDTRYLIIHHSYTHIHLGLYKEQECITTLSLHKHQASSLLIDTIKQILETHLMKLTDLAFIAVNQGPGPFTTLRTVIATVNGLNFALGIPLVGVDSIQALINEYHSDTQHIVALLNAFNQDVYFARHIPHANRSEVGYHNITTLLQQIAQEAHNDNKPYLFVGNGAQLHQELILKMVPHSLVDMTVDHCSLQQIAQEAFKKWHKKEYTLTQIQPLYIKNTVYNNLDISFKALPEK